MNIRFSRAIKEIISRSREEAVRLGNDSIDSGHLLLALIGEGNSKALKLLLVDFKLDLPALTREIELAIDEKTSSEDHHPLQAATGKSIFSIRNFLNSNSTPLTMQAENIVRHMVSEARLLQSAAVEPEHLLLSMLANGESIAAKILHQFGVSYEKTASLLGDILAP